MKFLKSLGLTVLETSEPEDYVSTKTFLFTPYGPRDVKTSTIGAAQPALFLGIDLRNRFWCSENGWLTEGSRRYVPFCLQRSLWID